MKSLMPTYQTKSYSELTLPIERKTALFEEEYQLSFNDVTYEDHEETS